MTDEDKRNYLEVLGLENMSLKELLEETEARKNLSKLEKTADGRPILHLTPLADVAVNTTTQEDYWILLRVYECGSWGWVGGESFTGVNYWIRYGSNTSIDAGVSYNKRIIGKACVSPKEFLISHDWKIILPQEFYKIQKITPEILNEVNEYFEKKK
ncbi:MAG: hypothetical protein Q7S33_01985 [Nanoarchaeota archaeon]|nr:hypothetical protein [Nanoarchaeota archaeon]